MTDFKKDLERCTQNAFPPCATSCPFHWNTRDFVKKIKRGAFSQAYKTFLNAVVFPEIVCRICPRTCESVCAERGDKVSLSALEWACIQYAKNREPNNYNLPPKPQRIAVIGAGLSGLSCALRLASRKYIVTVYDEAWEWGGSLASILPKEEYDGELTRQFMYEQVSFVMGNRVTDLSSIDADAYYIATGLNGDSFDFPIHERRAFIKDGKGFFFGGMLLQRSLLASIVDGAEAAVNIDTFLKIGEVSSSVWEIPSRQDCSLSRPNSSSGISHLSEEEAACEAEQCSLCQCSACVTSCDLMRYYHKYPGRIYEEAVISIQPVSLSRNARVATRLIASCMHCGLCNSVCPNAIDLDSFLLDSHRQMKERKAMPWAYHEFFLRDMVFSNKEASFRILPPNGKPPKYLFFPGCQISGVYPETVKEVYRYLASKEDCALLSACCGAPAEWGADESLHLESLDFLRHSWEELEHPTLIFACMNCMKEFQKYLPEIPGISIYDYLNENLQEFPVCHDTVSVFDPCSSRDYSNVHESVRSLAQKIGLSLEPLPEERDKAQCCSWGGQIEIANPAFSDYVAQRRISEGNQPYLIYCANCHEEFSRRRKENAHILSLLFSGETNWKQPSKSATQKRDNRLRFKEEMLSEYGQGGQCVMSNALPQVIISDELLEKIDADHLLRDDVIEVIAYCERSGKKLRCTRNESNVGHCMIGNLTVWVEYTVQGTQITLLNAYSHRMKVLEGRQSVEG